MRAVDAAVLAAWSDAYARGLCPDTIVGAFLNVAVVDPDHAPRPFIDRLRELREFGPGSVRLLLPVPGDPAGLDPSAAAGTAAIDAGAALLWAPVEVRDPRSSLLWSHVGGSADVMVLAEHRVPGHQPPGDDVPTAARALAEAMRSAADELSALDIGSGRESAERHVERRLQSEIGLPPDSDVRARDLLERALLILAAVEAARAVPPELLTVSLDGLRSQSLRPLAAAGRRAAEAATAALAGPIR